VAAEADREDRLEAGGDDEHAEQDVGRRRRARESGDRGRRRERGAHPLSEALRRPGDVLRRAESRRGDARRELAERAERRPSEDARPEAVRERHEQPVRGREQGDERDYHHHPGYDPRGLLVDRIGEREHQVVKL